MVLAVEGKGLGVGFETERGVVWVVEGLDIYVERGITYCLIGESGCGKSTIGNAIAGLLPPYAHTRGRLSIEGVTVIDGDTRRFNGVRGRIVVKIFQDPASALNPFMTVGEQISLALKRYFPGLSDRDLKIKALEILQEVRLGEEVYNMYPHQLSGGMKQRVAIALALAPEPKIVVADEPTSALDAYLRYAIASLLKRLQKDWELTLIFITHDVDIAMHICDIVAVVYAGRFVEVGRAAEVLSSPMHPYLELLLKANPKRLSKDRLADIPGMPPPPGKYPSGCKFHPRCPYVFSRCISEEPHLIDAGDRFVRCWRAHGGSA